MSYTILTFQSPLEWYNVGIMLEKKNSAIPVRLTEDAKVQLSLIAEETGLTTSTLIRLLITSLISHYKKNNRHITLPIKWKDLISSDNC